MVAGDGGDGFGDDVDQRRLGWDRDGAEFQNVPMRKVWLTFDHVLLYSSNHTSGDNTLAAAQRLTSSKIYE